MSISTIILNQILVAYGNAPVAAIGIVFKANMFITFLQMGLANGVQPLLGYSYGAGNRERFIAVERYTKKCCLIVGVLATALFPTIRTSKASKARKPCIMPDTPNAARFVSVTP